MLQKYIFHKFRNNIFVYIFFKPIMLHIIASDLDMFFYFVSESISLKEL